MPFGEEAAGEDLEEDDKTDVGKDEATHGKGSESDGTDLSRGETLRKGLVGTLSCVADLDVLVVSEIDGAVRPGGRLEADEYDDESDTAEDEHNDEDEEEPDCNKVDGSMESICFCVCC